MLKILGAIIIVLIVLAVFATAAKNKGRSNNTKKDYDYKSKTPLTKNEQAMYWKLIDTLPGYVVLAQVELSRCISAKGAAFNTINGKSLDFVICNKALEVVAAIEIDDKSHATPAAQKRDATKNNAMEIAGIKLIRWPATPLPSIEQIQENFPAVDAPVAEKPPIESTQDKKIKILEQQLFNMARKLEKADT
ncbi:DUF2726 domain-containing protein [Collimonas sp.]|uniref:DUF2726 domain-containing protein n=1 Tax=Collimonas sp. TaxID=1963772 RepID=UPI002B7CCB97|nr:DUF2726 domain-containing protein [Collimonas sp.]HWW06322.1 DUF2726 domain-containing protein [Collimonas sp.]